ncbi:MAG: hypothetical protein ACXWM8_01490 [Candidatus Limnocylindrales bacterium]
MTIIGGKAASVVPALMQYVVLKGLPLRPPTLNLPDYVRLARLSNPFGQPLPPRGR